MRKQEPSEGLTGWVAKLSDGTVVKESDGSKWGDVKDRIKHLCLVFRGTTFKLPEGMSSYFQKHSGSCELDGTGIKIISRTVGFTSPFGTVVSLTVHEDSGDVYVEET